MLHCTGISAHSTAFLLFYILSYIFQKRILPKYLPKKRLLCQGNHINQFFRKILRDIMTTTISTTPAPKQTNYQTKSNERSRRVPFQIRFQKFQLEISMYKDTTFISREDQLPFSHIIVISMLHLVVLLWARLQEEIHKQKEKHISIERR